MRRKNVFHCVSTRFMVKSRFSASILRFMFTWVSYAIEKNIENSIKFVTLICFVEGKFNITKSVLHPSRLRFPLYQLAPKITYHVEYAKAGQICRKSFFLQSHYVPTLKYFILRRLKPIDLGHTTLKRQ